MIEARPTDRKKVIDLIVKCYESNASVVWILRQDRFFRFRLRIMALYCFHKGMSNKGVFFSSNTKGMCVFYPLNREKNGFKAILSEVLLALLGIGLFRLPGIVRRDNYIRKNRFPKNALYAWMIAVDPASRTGKEAREMRNYIFDRSDSLGIPVLAETSMPQNKRVYERIGFSVYHEWKDQKTGMITWFMRREPAHKI